jgi:TolA-binding protein
VYYEIGDGFYNKRDFRAAMVWYEDVIKKYPDSQVLGEAINGLQWSAMQMGQVDQAFKVADQYIRENPESQLSQELLLRRGDFYFGLNRYQESIYAYQNFLRTYPGSLMAPKAQYWIGLSYYNLKQPEDAIQAFNKLARQYPDSDVVPDALFQLGIINREKNQFDQSIKDFSRILSGKTRRSQDPAFISEVYYQQGLTYLKQGDDERAKGVFQRSIQSQKGAFSAYQSRMELARIFARSQDLEHAKEYLNQIIQDRNDELAAQAQKVLGDVYFNAGNYPEALTNYLRVKYVYQGYPTWVANALYSAGSTHEKMGQIDEAKKIYKEVINKYPAEKISEKAKERLAAL